MKIYLPPTVKYIIDTIYEHNYEAYIVGGCVRDALLGIEPHDYDITTSAPPKVVLDIFKDFKCIETGIEHGTVSVLIEDNIYEITTYRIESEYKDHRRPENVDFTENLEEDLKRRDFTINAMAYNDKNKLIDLFEGQKDLKRKIIKTVGNPYDRFNEDGLRMIRAIRFSSKLNFDIEENTLNAIYDNAEIIKNISLERITDEFSKILLSDKTENINYLFKTNLFKYLGICSDGSEYKLENIYNKISILNKVKKDIVSRLSTLDYLIEEDINYEKIATKLIYSKKIIKNYNIILSCLKNINVEELDKIKVKKILNKIDKNLFIQYLEVSKIIYDNKEKVSEILDILNDIEENKECYTIKNLNINGNDILSLGYKNKDIGNLLNYLLNEVIKDNKLNEKDVLIKKIEEYNK